MDGAVWHEGSRRGSEGKSHSGDARQADDVTQILQVGAERCVCGDFGLCQARGAESCRRKSDGFAAEQVVVERPVINDNNELSEQK